MGYLVGVNTVNAMFTVRMEHALHQPRIFGSCEPGRVYTKFSSYSYRA